MALRMHNIAARKLQSSIYTYFNSCYQSYCMYISIVRYFAVCNSMHEDIVHEYFEILCAEGQHSSASIYLISNFEGSDIPPTYFDCF